MITFDAKEFNKKLEEAIQYSKGFVAGVESNKQFFLFELSHVIKQAFYKYVDSSARIDPSSLRHMYEWGQVGEAGGRLFELEDYVGTGFIRYEARFLPSGSVPPGGTEPFVEKATVMEEGMSVTIKPQSGDVLAFEGEDGEMVFTPQEVTVNSPGGPNAEGGFERAFQEFFRNYLDKAFIREITKAMRTADEFSRGWGNGMNYSRGVRMGKEYVTIRGGIS